MSELDHIGDWLDYINEHKVYRYLYLIVVSYIWIKFKATRLFGKIAIWIFRQKLYVHPLFAHIEIMTVSIPSQIRNMGKKLAFIDFLKIEASFFVMFLQSFIRRLCKIETSHARINLPQKAVRLLKLEKDYIKAPYLIRYFHEMAMYFYNFEDTTETLPRRMISDYDDFLKELPEIFESGLSSRIYVPYGQIEKYAMEQSGRKKIRLTDDEKNGIREILQKKHIKMLIAKYDRVMSDYRVQIKKNLALQITSELNLFDQIKSILKYSFQAVYSAMEVSFPKKVNDINGELSGIFFDEFDCGEKRHRGDDQ